MTRAKRWIAGFAALSVLLLAACGSKGAAAESTDTLKVAAVAAGPFTQQFNPFLLASQNASGYAKAIYETLLMDDYATDTTKPWLATSFSWGDGGRSLTINLRDGVKWSDGTAMTAEDVAFTFDLLRNNAGLNAFGLPLAGSSAPTKTQAVVTFSKPSYQVIWWRTAIEPQQLWANVKDPVKYANPTPVGTGPYAFKTFSPQVITLTKNPYYWQQGMPHVSTLQYLSYDSDASMIAALQSGQVDWISPATSDPAAVAKRAPGRIGYWVTKPNNSMVFLIANHTTYPTDQVAVRQAISQAVDRAAISKLALGGQNQPADSPTGLDIESRGDIVAPEFRDLRYGAGDPARAKATLAAAGYKLGSDGVFITPQGGPLSIELMVPSTNPYGDWVRVGRVMQTQLAAAGIKLAVKTQSQIAWRSDSDLGNFQLTLHAIGGSLSVYDLFYRIFQQDKIVPVGKDAQRNYERYRNPEAGTLLSTYATAAPGSPEESSALSGLQRLMVNDAPVIPMFFTAGVGMWRTDRFSGWPSASDPYAVSVGNSPNAEMVVMRVTPKAR
jgi:peptide/nickel transport system substrate-binding protein